MIIDFHTLQSMTIPGMNGGTGEMIQSFSNSYISWLKLWQSNKDYERDLTFLSVRRIDLIFSRAVIPVAFFVQQPPWPSGRL